MSDARAGQFQLFQRKGSSIWWVRFSIRSAGQIRNSLATADEGEARRKAEKIWRDATYRAENGLRPVQRSFERVAEEFIEQLEREVERGERRTGVDRRHACRHHLGQAFLARRSKSFAILLRLELPISR